MKYFAIPCSGRGNNRFCPGKGRGAHVPRRQILCRRWENASGGLHANSSLPQAVPHHTKAVSARACGTMHPASIAEFGSFSEVAVLNATSFSMYIKYKTKSRQPPSASHWPVPIAHLYQHRRERDGHRAPRLPRRIAMATGLDALRWTAAASLLTAA